MEKDGGGGDDERPDLFGRKKLKSTTVIERGISKPVLDKGAPVTEDDVDRPVDNDSIGSVKTRKDEWDTKIKEKKKKRRRRKFRARKIYYYYYIVISL